MSDHEGSSTPPTTTATCASPSSSSSSSQQHQHTTPRSTTLSLLLLSRSFGEASRRARSHPEEARCDPRTVNCLALACRLGAPSECVEAVLRAWPPALREGDGLARGTPLHEAICNTRVPLDVVRSLIRTDAELDGSSSERPAALTQDADGQIPLHLLVRRYFCFCPDDDAGRLLETLRELIRFRPRACAVTDRRDFEETPLVLALKANMYANYSDDAPGQTALEGRIHAVVGRMLEANYEDQSLRESGNDDDGPFLLRALSSKAGYTPLHSAVYHGRCAETVRLLVAVDPADAGATNHARWETPLHFAAMKGESGRVLDALLSTEEGRRSVIARDRDGLTPMHWAWIRTVKSLAASEGRESSSRRGGFGGEREDPVGTTILEYDCRDARRDEGEESVRERSITLSSSSSSSSSAPFDRAYYRTMRELDPPLDFRQMRHVPRDWTDVDSSCASLTIAVLRRLVSRFRVGSTRDLVRVRDSVDLRHCSRVELAVLLFWEKLWKLLRAAHCPPKGKTTRTFRPLHAAAASLACPPSVARIVAATARPEDLVARDERGDTPLHAAAGRPTRTWSSPSPCPTDDGRPVADATDATAAATRESSLAFVLAAGVPARAARIANDEGRLPLHVAVETLVRDNEHVTRAEDAVLPLLRACPEALGRRDGRTGLWPFAMAALRRNDTTATTIQTTNEQRKRRRTNDDATASDRHDLRTLDLSYALLRENPALLATGLAMGGKDEKRLADETKVAPRTTPTPIPTTTTTIPCCPEPKRARIEQTHV